MDSAEVIKRQTEIAVELLGGNWPHEAAGIVASDEFIEHMQTCDKEREHQLELAIMAIARVIAEMQDTPIFAILRGLALVDEERVAAQLIAQFFHEAAAAEAAQNN
jgi:hypothetical protein